MTLNDDQASMQPDHLSKADSSPESETPSRRAGLGTDRHRLEEGEYLVLAGIRIPSPLKAVAHSDGDALLHALADAILGGCGESDIGTHFPDDDPRWKDVDSTRLIEEVLLLAGKKGWVPVQIDTVVHLEKPRLKEYVPKMKMNLAQLLGISEDAIGLKAKTAEGLGPVSEGLAVDTFAIVQLERTGN
ncbi:MAG: 2-C-methyl-D-erythritol 2,4-cyclodiphosphate synthase [Planctomycetia bacterium]|nr:2-C-methyl-D-erythritol 2,4-cyclodiphosphate synthase [Planctomycetia bacterium]